MLVPYGSVSTILSPDDASLSILYRHPFTLPVKALVLLDMTARLAARARADAENRKAGLSSQSLFDRSEVTALEPKLLEFIRTLRVASDHIPPPETQLVEADLSLPSDEIVKRHSVDPSQSYAAVRLAPIYALTTVYASLIELYGIDAEEDPEAYAAKMSAARSIANVAHDSESLATAKFGTAVGVCLVTSLVISSLVELTLMTLFKVVLVRRMRNPRPTFITMHTHAPRQQ